MGVAWSESHPPSPPPSLRDDRPEWSQADYMEYLDGDTSDFEGLKLVDALHMMYANAKLPGDAQVIDRILGRFSEKYLECNRGRVVYGFELEDANTIHMLCFSMLMLTTDLHSSNVLRKMSKDEFRRQMFGMNRGANFPESYLYEIYDTIKEYPLGIAKRELVRDGTACVMTKSAAKSALAALEMDDNVQRIIHKHVIEDNRPGNWERVDFQRVLHESDAESDGCNLEGLDVLDALHLLLSHGKLHAEAQVVRLIVSDFADKYYEVNKEHIINGMEFTNADDVSTLCFGIIMLDSDQRNDQMKRKMTRDEFTRNLREFPKDYIHHIYDTIRQYPLGVAKRDLVRYDDAFMLTKNAAKGES